MKEYIIYYITLGAAFYFTYLIFKSSEIEESQKYDSLVNEFKFFKVIVFFIIIFLYPLFFLIAFFRFIKKKQHLVSIFFSSSLQIFFVSVNTILISKEMIIQAGICGFLLSLVWTFNIKRIGIASWGERISYCLGAGIGTSSGIIFIKMISKII
jgi:hypothetical protein